MKMVRLLFFGFLSLGASVYRAQGEECATVLTPEQIQFELDRFPEGWVYPDVSAAPPECMAMTIHIVRRSDGTGGLTLPELENAINDMNAQYQNVPMRFYRHGGVDYIDDDDFYLNSDNFTMWDSLLRTSSTANTINVYFVPNTGICGLSTFTTSSVQGMIVDNACAGNTSTFAHEMGHFFNLYHTHETSFGVECPDGSNCATAGDRLCDTPADPVLQNHVNINCQYDNFAGTPSGCTGTYAPQTDNLMSYSRKECRDLFTTDQKNKMVFTRNSAPNRISLITAPCAAETVPALTPTGTILLALLLTGTMLWMFRNKTSTS
jgi:hypothetical protein